MSANNRFVAKNGLDNNGFTITNVAQGTADDDVATRGYSRDASNIDTGTLNANRLALSGVSAGSYGTAQAIPVLTIDNKGRVTSATSVPFTRVTNFTYTPGTTTFTIFTGDGTQFAATIPIAVNDQAEFGSFSFDAASTTFTYVSITTEEIQDVVGGMFTTNSELGLVTTYNDTTGKIDIDVDDFTISLSGDLAGTATISNLSDATIIATIQPNSVALGTDTTGNYIAIGATAGNGISGAATGEGSTFTVTSNATSANTASTIVFRDANGDFSARAIVLTGDITVNGGDINFPPTASIGSLTTSLSIGATTGTTTVRNNLTVGGNLVVNGSTTTVNSTVTTINDPIITVGNGTTVDDNKDRGVEFKWHNGAALKTGFFGFDDSTGFFTFIPDGTNTSEVFSGATGVLDATRITGTASAWTTPRTITLAGDLTGSVSIDGSTNVTLSAQVLNDSHTHDGRYYTEAESDARFVNVTGDTMTGVLTLNFNSTLAHINVGSSGAGTNDYNYVLSASNDTGTKAVHFINSSTRAGDGGVNTYTIRNDGGPLRLGRTTQPTIFEGTNISLNSTGTLTVGADMRAPIYFDSNNTAYYGDFAGTSYLEFLGRRKHETGHLVGSYNNIGENSAQSNPIYTIGSSYNPAATTLGNMYGIGYSLADAAGYVNLTGANGWGMYVAADGDARIFLDATNGRISSTSEHYVGANRVFHDGYHPNADTWTTARTITLAGDLTGSVSINGSANVTLSAQVVNDSHTHDGRYYTEAESDARFIIKNTGYEWTGTGGNALSFRSLDVLETSAGDQAALEVYQDNAGADAFMQFHVAGDYAAYFGLKGDINDFAVGGWSAGAVAYRVHHEGNVGALDSTFTRLRATADIRAPIFYDSNNTAYFLDLSSTGQCMRTPGTIQIDNANSKGIRLLGTSPTITFADDNTSGFIHVNYNLMYILRGVANAGEGGWSQVNGQWPFIFNLSNNDATCGGNFTAVGNVNSNSDIRIKRDIKPIDNALEKVKQIRGVTFKRNDNETDPEREFVGVIAQEVEKVLPQVVSEDDEGIKSVSYGNMVSLLIEAVKEQQQQIEELKKQIEKPSLFERIKRIFK